MKRIYIYIMYSLLCTTIWAQDGIGTYLRDVIQKQEKGILVTAKLIEACGLYDTLNMIRDERYEILYRSGLIQNTFTYTDSYGSTYNFYAPEHRYFGYTLFAEADEVWEDLLGKDYKAITVDDVAAYIQQNCQFTMPCIFDKNYSNPRNVLYQFVTYHLLNRRLMPNHLVEHDNEVGYNPSTKQLGVAVCEYYTTMGDRRLLRTFESAESEGIRLNRFPCLDNGRHGTYHELSCDPDKAGIRIDTENTIETTNAVIYPISGLLVFDQATAQNMGSLRLRMDVASFFPEMATNNIRRNKVNQYYRGVYLLNDDYYRYLEDVEAGPDTHFCYWSSGGWQDMQSDEIACFGMQDVTLRLPPVPQDGTYELRLGIQNGNVNRGMFQIYFGTIPDNLTPCGMPIDFREGLYFIREKAGNVSINTGAEYDTNDDMYNQTRDNELYENGLMKGCMQYCAGFAGLSSTMRESEICVRRVIGRMQMEAGATYYIRFKSVLDDTQTQLFLDYIEFCPESIYDNPTQPEDIW